MNNYQIESDIFWTNGMTPSYSHRFTQACNSCQEYKNNGMSRSEAEEMLIGKKESDIDKVLNHVYGLPQIKVKKNDLFVVPVSYSEVSDLIEDKLNKLGPDDFIAKLVDAPQPLLPVNKRHRELLLDLAKKAIEHPSYVGKLHEELKPYIEEAMLNSVLLADQIEDNSLTKIASSTYLINSRGYQFKVDIELGTSTGERFSNGYFAEFGLADEFMVKVADSVSPYARIRKALNNY